MISGHFICRVCGKTSHNAQDAFAGYCGVCHDYTRSDVEVLILWTIYDLTDEPVEENRGYLARVFEISGREPQIGTDGVASTDLDQLRSFFQEQGRVAVPRSIADEAHIVESWI